MSENQSGSCLPADEQLGAAVTADLCAYVTGQGEESLGRVFSFRRCPEQLLLRCSVRGWTGRVFFFGVFGGLRLGRRILDSAHDLILRDNQLDYISLDHRGSCQLAQVTIGRRNQERVLAGRGRPGRRLLVDRRGGRRLARRWALRLIRVGHCASNYKS